MKYKCIIVAFLASLISCETSNIDTISTMSEDIAFFISQDNNCTKGTPIDGADMFDDIGVFATLTQGSYAMAATPVPNFMLNQLVERSGDKWEYNPSQKWSTESGDRISFFAYAPFANADYGITIVGEGDKMPMIRYQVPETNMHHPDLMVATPVYDRVKSQGAVDLTLRHALAAISFSVKGDTSRVIKGVKLSNIVPAATLALDSLNIYWDDFAGRSSLLYELGLIGDVTPPKDGESAASITANDGYLMMIPQDITDVEVEVQVDGETELIHLNFESGSKWVAGVKYDYIIDLSTGTISYDISETSNCYIVNYEGVTEVYIPVDQRINAFWHDYSGLSESDSANYMIDNTTDWNAEVLWCDNADLLPNSITAVRYEGLIPEGCGSSKSYVCDGTKAVMRVTLPGNKVEGNILVAVTRDIDGEKSILWSWHLWVTAYNPDSEIHTASEDIVYDVEGGEIHRYTKGSDYWNTGLYASTFIMDRDIGSHDATSETGLFYQWGRKDPFSTIAGWDDKGKRATFDVAVQNPNNFYAHEKGWCREPSDDAYAANDYLWYDITLLNSDSNAFVKSIFDPSPLGWCVPLRGAYDDWSEQDDYLGVVHFYLTGDIHPTTGELQSKGVSTSLWCSDKMAASDAYYTYVRTSSISVDCISTAYGHRIRPVKIPK